MPKQTIGDIVLDLESEIRKVDKSRKYFHEIVTKGVRRVKKVGTKNPRKTLEEIAKLVKEKLAIPGNLTLFSQALDYNQSTPNNVWLYASIAQKTGLPITIVTEGASTLASYQTREGQMSWVMTHGDESIVPMKHLSCVWNVNYVEVPLTDERTLEAIACRQIAQHLHAEAKNKDARQWVDRAIQYAPKLWRSYLTRFEIATEEEDHNLADADLQTTLALDPTNRLTLALKAKSAFLREDWHTAKETYAQLIEAYKRRNREVIGFLKSFPALKKVSLASHASIDSSIIRAETAYVACCIETGDYQTAAAKIDELINAGATNFKPLRTLFRIVDGSKEEMAKAKTEIKEYEKQEDQLSAQLTSAFYWREKGNEEKAKKAYDAIIKHCKTQTIQLPTYEQMEKASVEPSS